MSSPAKPVMQLRPGEWKQNALFNLAGIQNYVLSIPDQVESGAAGIQPEHLALIDAEIERVRLFLRSWQRSRFDVPSAEPAQEPHAGNGAAEPKRKGGWPKGKSRKVKIAPGESVV